ncbi:MAG: caspase domain-containing protein, partial [Thiohalomonadales bacterium]
MNNFNRFNFIITWAIVLFAAIFISSQAYAARYALLVGVGDYPMAELEGPVNDVNAIQEVLISTWGFKKANIRTLINKKGTKKNILAEMEELLRYSKKGDEIFIYFSGHGTSAKDKALHFPLPTTSGAFIPYDVRDARSVTEILNVLVVGKTDLRPLLTRLDQGGRHVFVVVDSCYSGNAVRGAMIEKNLVLPSRYLDLQSLLPGRAFGDDLINTGDEVWQKKPENPNEVYPYENIYFLSASGEHEQAKDIPSRLLNKIPTIDGKAHGAFTDTLLRILNKPASADLNSNGELSYAEITKTVRKLMRRRGFDHTPNGLPSIAQDRIGLATRGLFRNKLPTQKVDTFSKKILPLKVNLADGFDKLESALRQQANIIVVKSQADISVKWLGTEIVLSSAAGDIITRTKKSDVNSLVKLIAYQASIHNMVNGPLSQNF